MSGFSISAVVQVIPGKNSDCRWSTAGLLGSTFSGIEYRLPLSYTGAEAGVNSALGGVEIRLPDGSVQGIFCNVALPYMHIPRTLGEVHRVLVPGRWLKATLHAPSFTWSELRKSFPCPKQSLFRVFAFLNGVVLHFSGNVISLGRVAESFQTDAGMRMALRRAGLQR